MFQMSQLTKQVMLTEFVMSPLWPIVFGKRK